jgi:hypothetical protein
MAQRTPNAIPTPVLLGGWSKFGTTPWGGVIAGPLRICCWTSGGRLGNWLSKSAMARNADGLEDGVTEKRKERRKNTTDTIQKKQKTKKWKVKEHQNGVGLPIERDD